MQNLYKRGNIWWGRVERKGRDIRRSLKTSNRAVAQRRLREWLDELEAIQWGDKPRQLFDAAVERFVREHLTIIKVSSAKRYAISLRHLAEHLEGKFLHEITSSVLYEFETKRRQKGASVPTIRRDLACLSSMMGCCELWEWIDANPVPKYMRRRRRQGLKEAPPRTRYLTRQEEKALLAAAVLPETLSTKQQWRQRMLHAAIAVAIDTGFRREELFSLKWNQVDFHHQEVRTTPGTKNGLLRRIPLHDRSVEILSTLPRYLHSEYVFHHPNGRRYLQMNKGFKGAAKRAGIQDLRWHDLRRTCGCRLLQEHGKKMHHVREWLGHHSVTVTEKHYAFLRISDLHAGITTGTQSGTKPGTRTTDSKLLS